MHVHLNRRGFLEQTSNLVAGAMVIGATRTASAASVVAPAQPTVARIGLQLYTVRDRTAADMDKALEGVATVGYKVVEFAGYNNVEPEKIRATLDPLKMTSPSTHIGLDLLRKDLAAQMHIAEALGHRYITVPSFGGSTPSTLDAWKRASDEFNTIGTKLKARKIGLAFHSHRDEFADVGGGKKGMDVFISSTDPNLVAFQIDLGWAKVAGQNPADWFNRYPGRFKMWHVKDILALTAAQERQAETFRTAAARQSASPPAPSSPPPPAPPAPAARGGGAATPAVTGGPVPVGAGEIDYKPIFPLWKTSGLEHFFVEQDGAADWPGGSLVAIATSYRNLVNLLS